jgi:polar amino acid transport system permease protein
MLQLPEIYTENIHRWLPELLYFSLTTLKIAFVSFLLAVAIGLLFAICRTSNNRVLRVLAIAYIEMARGLPIVVLLYIVYFVPPQLFPKLNWQWFSDFTGAVIGLALHGVPFLQRYSVPESKPCIAGSARRL